jgi:hypothetical protein
VEGAGGIRIQDSPVLSPFSEYVPGGGFDIAAVEAISMPRLCAHCFPLIEIDLLSRLGPHSAEIGC